MRIMRLQAEAGFTAMEVMLAVVLLAIGTSATAGLLLVATAQGTYSRQVSDAATLAEQTEEQYRGMNFSSMADSCSTATTSTSTVGVTTYTVATNVCLATPQANMNQITITVKWGSGDGRHTYVTQTILTALQ